MISASLYQISNGSEKCPGAASYGASAIEVRQETFARAICRNEPPSWRCSTDERLFDSLSNVHKVFISRSQKGASSRANLEVR